jgi:hypothetical protein
VLLFYRRKIIDNRQLYERNYDAVFSAQRRGGVSLLVLVIGWFVAGAVPENGRFG